MSVKLFGPKMQKYFDTGDLKLVKFGTPKPLHGINPRNALGQVKWDLLRKEIFKEQGGKCAICGDVGTNQGSNWDLEGHEIMDYDFDKEVQYFLGIVGLCPRCHKVIHYAQPQLALSSGGITRAQFNGIRHWQDKQYELVNKECKTKHVKENIPVWHSGNWKSDFTKINELWKKHFTMSMKLKPSLTSTDKNHKYTLVCGMYIPNN